ncbi:hypothetical protein [Brevibacillus sp. M2.1A]|uniref:hypothetical protein n=1 Tax=Brevibacillus sp. M2.1A TaxID=2738980 RepID=UPI00351D612D
MAKKIDNLFGSSRFVLPEQRELYLSMKEDDKLVPMPILEQDELESFITNSETPDEKTMLSQLLGGNARKIALELLAGCGGKLSG